MRPAGSTSGSGSRTASGPRWSRSTRSAARASRSCSISNLPPTSAGGAPTIDPAHSGIYFGERPQLVRRRRRPAERVRLPDRRERHRGLDRDRDALDGDDGHRARQRRSCACCSPRASVTSTCSSATRSRRQPAALPPLAQRPPVLVAPFLRLDKDPTSSSATRAGWSTSRTRSRPRTGFPTPRVRPGGARDGSRRRGVQLHPQQRQDHRRRLRRHDALLHQRPGRPDHPRLPGRLSRRCSSRLSSMPADLPRTCVSLRTCSTSRPRIKLTVTFRSLRILSCLGDPTIHT